MISNCRNLGRAPSSSLSKIVASDRLVVSSVSAFLWQSGRVRQNSICRLMHLDPVDTAHPCGRRDSASHLHRGDRAGAVVQIFGSISSPASSIALCRKRQFPMWWARRSPFQAVLVGGQWRHLSAVWGVRVLDSSFQRLDALMPPDMQAPTDPTKTCRRRVVRCAGRILAARAAPISRRGRAPLTLTPSPRRAGETAGACLCRGLNPARRRRSGRAWPWRS